MHPKYLFLISSTFGCVSMTYQLSLSCQRYFDSLSYAYASWLSPEYAEKRTCIFLLERQAFARPKLDQKFRPPQVSNLISKEISTVNKASDWLPAEHYNEILISRTLIFSNLPITRTKSRSLSSVKHYNFTPDFSNSPISRTNLCFPWRFEKSGFHCSLNHRTTLRSILFASSRTAYR